MSGLALIYVRRSMVRALNAEELNEWHQYGDLLLLRRERRERAGAASEVARMVVWRVGPLSR